MFWDVHIKNENKMPMKWSERTRSPLAHENENGKTALTPVSQPASLAPNVTLGTKNIRNNCIAYYFSFKSYFLINLKCFLYSIEQVPLRLFTLFAFANEPNIKTNLLQISSEFAIFLFIANNNISSPYLLIARFTLCMLQCVMEWHH